MKHTLIIAIIVLATNLFGAEVVLTSAKSSGLELSWDIENYVINKESSKNLVSLGDCENQDITWNNFGYNLPQYSKLVIIPEGCKPSLNVTNVNSSSFENVNLDNFKSKDSLQLPDSAVNISQVYKYKGLRFCSIAINPVSFNKKSNSIKIFERANINIDFTRGSEIASSELKISKNDVEMLQDMVLNRDMISAPTISDDGYFVIIYNCDPNENVFESTIARLASWKRKCGFMVKTQNFNSNNSFSNIKNYLVDGYTNWDMPPKWICIIGDTDEYAIPPDYETFSYSQVAGDYKYTLLEANDNFPDAYIGRLSIRNSSQLLSAVNKIVAYEKSQFTPSSDFLDNSLLIGDPADSGISTIIASDYIKDYIKEYDPQHNIDQFSDGSFVNHMTTAMNSGISTLFYRGFAGISGFSVSNVDNLTNIKKPFFGAFITCHTNVFDGYAAPSSVCEALVNAGTSAAPKGAIGAIGASSETHTCLNNLLIEGIAEAMYSKDLNAMGEALHYGKLQLVRNYPTNPNQLTMQYMQCMNLIGDPSVRIQRKALLPTSLLSHDEIGVNENFLEVQYLDEASNPIVNATVSISSGNVVHAGKTDNNGRCTLDVSDIGGNIIELLGLKDEYQTSYKSINKSAEVINYTVAGTGAVSPTGDVAPIMSGSSFDLDVQFANYSGSDLTNATLTLSGEYLDNDVQLDNVNLASIDVDSADYSTITFNTSLIAGIDFDEQINLNLEIIAEGVNQTLPFFIIENSVEFDLIRVETNNSDYIAQDIATLLDINLDINTEFDLSLEATLFEPSELTTLMNETQQLSVDSNNENAVISYSLMINNDVIPGTVIPFELKITDPNNNFERILTFNLQVYNTESTYPTGPDNYGYLCYSNLDAGDNAPTYEWFDISPSQCSETSIITVTDMNESGSGDYQTISLPFDFSYYGEVFNDLTVCSNGIAIAGQSYSTDWMNSSIPGPGSPNGMLSPFWDDLLFLDASNGIYYYHDSDNSRFIVQWNAKNKYNYTEEKFQLVIFDNATTDDNLFQFNYDTVANIDSGSYGGFSVSHGEYATVGITSPDGTDGIEYTYSNKYPQTAHVLQDDMSLLFTPILYGVTPNNNDEVSVAQNNLFNNYPNPFNPETNISFNLKENGKANLSVYNVKGQLVKELLNDTFTKGEHRVVWNGTDNQNRKVSSGVYYYKLTTKSDKIMKKMVLMK